MKKLLGLYAKTGEEDKLYLFDASSILNLIKRGLIKQFAEGVTLDLALYESLNALWKEYKLLRKIDKDTALEFINIISDLFNVIKTLSIKGFENEVFNLASKENLSIYDAAYTCSAIKNKLILITDDKELKEKASKYIEAICLT